MAWVDSGPKVKHKGIKRKNRMSPQSGQAKLPQIEHRKSKPYGKRLISFDFIKMTNFCSSKDIIPKRRGKSDSEIGGPCSQQIIRIYIKNTYKSVRNMLTALFF